MREILFQGKSLDDGKWVTGYYTGPVGLDTSHEICDINDPVGSRVDVNPETLGQYSGRTDLKRKRIFEGDIVKLTILGGNEFITVCTFEEGAFGLRWTWQGVERFAAFTSICNSLFEVVGNIYDTPERLNEDLMNE